MSGSTYGLLRGSMLDVLLLAVYVTIGAVIGLIGGSKAITIEIKEELEELKILFLIITVTGVIAVIPAILITLVPLLQYIMNTKSDPNELFMLLSSEIRPLIIMILNNALYSIVSSIITYIVVQLYGYLVKVKESIYCEHDY